LEKILEALQSIDQNLRKRQQQVRSFDSSTQQINRTPEKQLQSSKITQQDQILKTASEATTKIRKAINEYSSQPGLADLVIDAVRQHLSKALDSINRFEDRLLARHQEKTEMQQQKQIEKTLSKMPEIRSLVELHAVLDHLQKKLDNFSLQLSQEKTQDRTRATNLEPVETRNEEKRPAQERSPVAQQQKPEKHAKVQSDDKLTIVKLGTAPYQFDTANDPSYFVQVRNQQGIETFLWGKGLETAIHRAGAHPGDVITATRAGRVPVEVETAKLNDAGNVIGVKRIDTHRNEWKITLIESNKRSREKAITQEPPGWQSGLRRDIQKPIYPRLTNYSRVYTQM
jgi:hypothetical protein